MNFTENKKSVGRIIFWVGFAVSAACAALVIILSYFIDGTGHPIFSDSMMSILTGFGIFILGSIISWAIGVLVDARLAKKRR